MNWNMSLSGRLELEFGDIDCEFGASTRLLPLLLNSVITRTIFHGLKKTIMTLIFKKI